MKKEYIISGIFLMILVLFLKRKKIYQMLSKNFTLFEFEQSETATKYGIKNTIPEKYKENIKLLTENVLQPARDYLNIPIQITSGYRSPELIKKLKVDGYNVSSTTQHATGKAADLVTTDNKKLFDFIKNNLEFDQLIYEGGTSLQPLWVHVSYNKGKNRNQVLSL